MFSFVISKTPYRVSFFGGGTDYPVWYRDNPGAVLATSIDKYCYIMCRWLPPFFEHKYHISYSEIERPQEMDQIRHPAIREILRFRNIRDGVGIYHAGDLPARAGMGTSSAFTVGLLHGIYTMERISISKMALALDAIHIEQNMIGECVGSQDQITASFGGFNRIDFNGGDISRITAIKTQRVEQLESCLMLFFTGFCRTASQVAKEQIERIHDNRSILVEMHGMVVEGQKILTGNGSLSDFGELLGESWRLKKQLSNRVSTEYIDYLYASAISAGATGGKLLGAGGGGMLLLFVEPDLQARVKNKLSSLLHIPFRFENSGSQIIFGQERRN